MSEPPSAREGVPDLVPALPIEVLFHTGSDNSRALMRPVIIPVRIARPIAMATPRWAHCQDDERAGGGD